MVLYDFVSAIFREEAPVSKSFMASQLRRLQETIVRMDPTHKQKS